jgi:hypothetical protein
MAACEHLAQGYVRCVPRIAVYALQGQAPWMREPLTRTREGPPLMRRPSADAVAGATCVWPFRLLRHRHDSLAHRCIAAQSLSHHRQLFVLVAGWGYRALRTVPIDAIPDLSDNQVIVFTDWPGRSPQEVEDQITYPLTVGLQGLPGVRVVRSSSAFGFSMINVLFEDAVDIYFARTRVLERLNLLNKALP